MGQELDDVGWCEKCHRPFDRPKPDGQPGSGWRVCDECVSHKGARRLSRPKVRRKHRKRKEKHG